MASTTTQIVQTETTAVTRARTVATCARPATAVTAHGYLADGTGTNATRTFASAGTWSLAIRKPMSKVDFHDRWPLRPTL